MILLLSGGLDSIAIWRLWGCRAVNINLDTIAAGREEKAMLWAAEHFDMHIRGRQLIMNTLEQVNGYVPFRNPILILIAAQIDPIVVIGQIAEWAPDKNRRFYRRLERTVNVTGKLANFDGGLEIIAPFAHLNKGELIALYHNTFGRDETSLLLENTWSCYSNRDVHCGSCGGCVQRWNGEAHYVDLMDRQGIGSAELTKYQTEPQFVPTPTSDKFRWVRDNGLLGVRQIMARRKQNKSAEQRHRWA